MFFYHAGDIGLSNNKTPQNISSYLRKENPKNLRILEYEITTEPIQNRYVKRLPDHIKDKIDDLYDNIVEKKPDQTVVSELEALIDRYPKIPMLYNYLSMAYFRIGDQENYEKSIKKNYQLNPDYLFARLNYAQLCDQQGEHEKIAEIFNHKFDLKLLYPKRKKFHISEVANFMGIIGSYFFKTGEMELAEKYYKVLAELASDYPTTQKLRNELYPGFFRRIFRKISGTH